MSEKIESLRVEMERTEAAVVVEKREAIRHDQKDKIVFLLFEEPIDSPRPLRNLFIDCLIINLKENQM